LDQVGQIFPTLTADAAERFQSVISKAHSEDDSVGGRIECAITGLPAGIGEPMFGGVEGRLAQILYGIPAVKNVGFGASEGFAELYGSQSNDAFTIENGQIKTVTNTCGGILGGITNAMPVIFDVTIKPTSSIAKPQQTVNLQTCEVTTIQVKGRHDPCIVPRAVPVVEAAAAIAIFDMILGTKRG
jgi:chorismate synthase